MVIFSRIFLQGASMTLRRNLFENNFILYGSFYTVRPKSSDSKVKIKVVPPDPKEKELNALGYEERNERIKRVLSPHLTIYSPQLTSMLSITTRMTGVALTLYVWALGIGALLTSHDMEHFITMIKGAEMNDTCLTIGKFILVTPLTYHYFNSIRHILWAFGNMLKLDLVYSTGYLVLALTPITSIALSML